jgi:PAS domain S-box-containing protein
MLEDIHTLVVPSFIFDPETYFILDANERFTDLYGYSLTELKEMRVYQLRSPEEKQNALKLIESTRGHVIYSGESTHQKKDGQKMPVQVFGKRFHLDNKDFFLAKVKLKER